MLVKIGLAAALALAVSLPLSRVDYRETYNEMYPVNGLKRDVLQLCHQAEPTFVRALKVSRVHCYDSMPRSVDLAIGWVRTIGEVAAPGSAASAMELAERLLVEEVARGVLGQPRFTGYVTVPLLAPRPCAATELAAGSPRPLGESDEDLARRIVQGGDAALAAIGLGKPAPDAAHENKLPVLPLAGGAGAATRDDAALLRDLAPAPLLDNTAGAPSAPPAGCRTPA